MIFISGLKMTPTQINSMDEVNLIEDELWDHYSGLPNPLWYQYKKSLGDEEDDTDDSSSAGINNEKV